MGKDGALPLDTPLGPVDTFVIERDNAKGQVTAVWVPVETDQGRKFSAAAFCLTEKPQQLMEFRDQVTGRILSFEEFLDRVGVAPALYPIFNESCKLELNEYIM